MERNSRVKHAQVWAAQGWEIPREEGHLGKKSFRVKGCPDLGHPKMDDLCGGKKRVLVPVDHRFWVIFLS